MSKDIKNGIDKLVSNSSQIDNYNRAWRDIRNKLDSILMNTNVLKGDAIRLLCHRLDGLEKEDRYLLIKENWGIMQAEKARPILEQLEKLEKVIKAS